MVETVQGCSDLSADQKRAMLAIAAGDLPLHIRASILALVDAAKARG